MHGQNHVLATPMPCSFAHPHTTLNLGTHSSAAKVLLQNSQHRCIPYNAAVRSSGVLLVLMLLQHTSGDESSFD
jgi:hypothetical protein